MISQRTTLLAGAILAGLAVIVGAFGAHALKPQLLATNHFDTYELAVRYQFYHSFALLCIGLLMGQLTSMAKFKLAAIFMILGIIFFSGSLYALSFGAGKSIALATPIGGVFFILGWIWLGLGIAKRN